MTLELLETGSPHRPRAASRVSWPALASFRVVPAEIPGRAYPSILS